MTALEIIGGVALLVGIGTGAEQLINCTAFLNLDRLPPRLLFVGGGFISFEFAHIAVLKGPRSDRVERERGGGDRVSGRHVDG